MPSRPEPPTPTAFLGGFAPEVADVAIRLREALRARHPDLEERVYEGWGGLGYHVRAADGRGAYLGAIFPREAYVDVGLEHGVELADPRRLFYRGGKQLRYVRLDTWDLGRVDAILDLFDAAIAWQTR